MLQVVNYSKVILLQVNLWLTVNTFLYLVKSLSPISGIRVIFKLNFHLIQIRLPQLVHLYHLLHRSFQVEILCFLLIRDRLVLQHQEQRVVHYTKLIKKERILLQDISELIFLLIAEVDQSIIQIFIYLFKVHIFHDLLVPHNLAFLGPFPPFSILLAKFNFTIDGASFNVKPHLWIVFVF